MSITTSISLTKLAIICIGVVAGLALIVGVVVLFMLLRLRDEVEELSFSDSNGKGGEDKLSSHHIASIVVQSRRVRDYIYQQVETEVKKCLRNPDEKFISLITDNVYMNVRQLIKLDQKEAAQENARKEVEPTSSKSAVDTRSEQKEVEPAAQGVNKKVFYASALEEDNKTFYAVSDQPISDETIFKFTELKSGKCEFVIYEGAYLRVLADDAFLVGACKLTKTGNSKVIVTEKGVAELNSNSKWIVSEPAKVKFE